MGPKSLLAIGALAVCAGAMRVSAAWTAADSPPAPQAVVTTTCVSCHNDRARSGGISLQSFEVARAAEHAEIAEKMIRKLRAGQMPPAGSRRPEASALAGLADALEAQVDAHATE